MDFLKDLSWGTQNTYLLEQVHIDMCGVHLPWILQSPTCQNWKTHTFKTYILCLPIIKVNILAKHKQASTNFHTTHYWQTSPSKWLRSPLAMWWQLWVWKNVDKNHWKSWTLSLLQMEEQYIEDKIQRQNYYVGSTFLLLWHTYR